MLICFDMDGTLLDTEYPFTQAVAAMLREEGIPVDGETFFKNYAGMSGKFQIPAIARDYSCDLSEEQLERLLKRHRELKTASYQGAIQPFPFVRETLEALRQQGHVLALCSNTRTELCEEALRKTGLLEYFDGRIYTGHNSGASKPDPAMINRAMAENGFTPNETVHVDDSAAGVTCGARAFLKAVIAFIDPRFGARASEKFDQLRSCGATAGITDFRNLMRLLPGPAAGPAFRPAL